MWLNILIGLFVSVLRITESQRRPEDICLNPNVEYVAAVNDCTSFYQCQNGVGIHKFCGPGSVYDPEKHICSTDRHLWQRCRPSGDNPRIASTRLLQNVPSPVFPRILRPPQRRRTFQRLLEKSAFVCPDPDGFFRDATDCSLYYKCSNDTSSSEMCQEGEYFDLVSTSCQNKSLVTDCKTNAVSRGAALAAYSAEFECPESFGYFAHERDCRIFYHCVEGKAFQYSCGNLTIYDPETSQCGWPKQREGCDFADAIRFTRNKRDTNDSQKKPPFECPGKDGYFRDTFSCSVYYKCDNFEPTKMECDRHEIFDEASSTCIVSENGCPIGPLFIPASEPMLQELSGLTAVAGATGRQTSFSSNGGGYPSYPGSGSQNVNNPYSTAQGSRYPSYYNNPPSTFQGNGFRYQPPTRIQGYGGGYQQNNNRPISPGTFQSGTTSNQGTSNNRPTGTTDYGINTNYNPNCPDPDGFFRDPSDCRIFYVCVGNQQEQQHCGRGTVFDDSVNICRWPDEVPGCDGDRYKVPIQENSTPFNSGTYNSGTYSNGNISPGPYQNSGQFTGGGKNHGGQQRPAQIPPGNNNIGTGNRNPGTGNNNGQIPRYEGEYSSGRTPTYVPIPNTLQGVPNTSPNNFNGGNNLQTPGFIPNTQVTQEGREYFPNCQDTDGYYSDPVDCRIYYQCSKKSVTRLSCGPGSVFNPSEDVCDWPEHVPGCNDPKYKTTPQTTFSGQYSNTFQGMGPGTMSGKFGDLQMGVPDFECPEKNGYFRDTSDCAAYYQCDGGHASRVVCSPSQFFDSRSKKCVKKELVVECQSKDTPPTGNINFAQESPVLFVSFPCPTPEGYFRDMYICSVYYHCVHGQPYRRACPKGEFFDIYSHECKDSSEVIDCGSNGDFHCPQPNGYFRDHNKCERYFHCVNGEPYMRKCRDGEFFQLEASKCVPEAYVPECKPMSEITQSQGEVSSLKCPRPDGYFRDKMKCDVYYGCVNGFPFRYECEQGTYFDTKSEICVPMDYVTDCATSYQAREKEGSFSCPLPEGFFRDSLHCDVFYHCESGSPYRRQCPDGQYFSLYDTQCKAAKYVPDCISSSLNDVDNYDDYEDDEFDSPEVFECPEPNGYFRDDYDCSVYYHCMSNTPYKYQCKEGYAFDIDILMCSMNNLVDDCHDDDGPKRVANLETFASTPAMLMGESDTCPKFASGFYGDRKNCFKFYRCVVGTKFKFQCAPGTFFDTSEQMCNFKDRVPGCSKSGTRISSTMSGLIEPYTGTVTSRIDDHSQYSEPASNDDGSKHKEQETKHDSNDVDNPEMLDNTYFCPEKFGLFEHPTDCQTFVYCVKYAPIFLDCPRNLYYNSEKQTCDTKENVKCK